MVNLNKEKMFIEPGPLEVRTAWETPFPPRQVVYTESDCGTHLDGCHGWQNAARVVRKAMEHGFEIGGEELADLIAYENDHGDDENDTVSGQGGLSDRATDYLTEITAPGLEWVWDAGELTLMTEGQADEFGHHG